MYAQCFIYSVLIFMKSLAFFLLSMDRCNKLGNSLCIDHCSAVVEGNVPAWVLAFLYVATVVHKEVEDHKVTLNLH